MGRQINYGGTPPPQSERAQFDNLAPVTVNLNVEGIATDGQVDVLDPWYVDANGVQPDSQWISYFSGFKPSTMPNGGVFLNQSNPQFWDPPCYTICVPSSQTVTLNGQQILSYFSNWTAFNASLRDMSGQRTDVIFNATGATATARYKGHLRSSSSVATSSNSQRKIGYIAAKYHMVYESAGEVWYSSSEDNGATWSPEFLVSDGSGHSRQPSLAVNQAWSLRGLYVAIVWEWSDGESSIINVRGRNIDGSWSTPNPIWGGFCSPGYEGATPVMAMEDDFQVVAWRATEFDGWQDPGLYIWVNNGNDACRIDGTDGNSMHPSVAVPAYQQSKGRFGVAWSQNGEIYYKRYWYDLEQEILIPYSTEWPSQGSSLTELDYPSLVFIHSYGMQPSIAWQGIHPVTYLESVQVRRRTGSGWGTIQQYSHAEDFLQPSLTRHENPDTSLAMVWHDNNNLFLAKCTSSWGSRIDLTEGVCPSIGFDVTGNNSNFRILYTNPTTPLSSIATTNQSLPKAIASGGETLMRELTMLKGGVLESVVVKKMTLNEKEIGFEPYADGRTITSVAQAEEFLTAAPAEIASETLELQIESSVQLRGESTDTLSGTQLKLRVSDAQTGSLLKTYLLDSLASNVPYVATKSYTLPSIGLVGRTVRLSLLPQSAEDLKWTATLIHFDTAGVKKEAAPQIALGPTTEATPAEYQLEGAYPNPFNPATTLRYGLPTPSHVLLAVYDMLGRKVAEPFRGFMPAGSHAITWNATSLASGIYLARLVVVDESGKERINKVTKLLLMK